MGAVRDSNERLATLEPYDPKSLPARVFLSANENGMPLPESVQQQAADRVAQLALNRYPSPLADGLRGKLADAFGLEPANVLLGNGGDELLFNLFVAYGGPGRTVLNVPPTFSVYELNAQLTGTTVVNVPRREGFAVDERAVLERVSRGDIDIVIICNPNNPTGTQTSGEFLCELCASTDALVLVDEAYGEFAGESMLPHLSEHENLLILHTFSKAFSLAGIRVGYFLGSKTVIDQFKKVRQPYSVDAVSQAIAEVAFERRGEFFWQEVEHIIDRREQLAADLAALEGVTVWPSRANFLLVRVPDAHEVWQRLYNEHSVLVRDFSRAPQLQDCLRVTVGTAEENETLVTALKDVLG